MRQSATIVLGSLILSALLAVPAYSDGDKGKRPEDVFKAFAAAIKAGDVKSSVACLNRDSQSAAAALALFVACGDVVLDKKEVRAPFDQVLNRHGIPTDNASRKSLSDRSDLFLEVIGNEFPKNLVALGDSVRDKPAFVADVFNILRELGLKADEFEGIGAAKIEDVKIEGEQATGRVTIPGAEGKESTKTYYFKLENGAWKIDVIDTIRKARPQPQAQPAQPIPYCPRLGLLHRLRNW
jgi:hypothetical protein